MSKIYVVQSVNNPTGPTKRLVRAKNASQAWRHVAESLVMVDLASQDDLVELTSAGVKVEETVATSI